MGKYLSLGVILSIVLLVIAGLVVNHSSNTTNMEQIDTGIQSSIMGTMRDTEGDTFGMRTKDVVALITTEVAKKQSDTDKVIKVDYKFYTDEEGTTPVSYESAMANNTVIKSVQYRVELYSNKNLNDDYTIKNGAKAESSTENRIVLSNKLLN